MRKLSDQVKALEVENEEITKLFGEFLATIRVNWLRGHLVVEPKESNASFETIIDGFSKRFQTIKTALGIIGFFLSHQQDRKIIWVNQFV